MIIGTHGNWVSSYTLRSISLSTEVDPWLASPTQDGWCQAVSSLMAASCKLSKIVGKSLSDPFVYRSTVGALQYLNFTRPDIAFSVNKVAQFMQAPTHEHWSAVKWILCYLKFTIQHGIFSLVILLYSLLLTPMQIGQGRSMIKNLPVAIVSFLVQISFLGARRSRYYGMI